MEKVVVTVNDTLKTAYRGNPLIKEKSYNRFLFMYYIVMCFITLYAAFSLWDFVVPISICICILLLFAMYKSNKKKQQRMLTETRGIAGEKTYTISKDGLVLESLKSRTEYSWDELFGFRTDSSAFYFYYNSVLAYSISKDKLTSEEIAFITECAEAANENKE